MSPVTDHPALGREAVQAAREAIDAAIAEFDAAPPREVLEAAGTLGELLTDRSAEIRRVRALAAARLRREENLSFSELAEALGVSKGRADQLVKWAESGFRHDPKPHRAAAAAVGDKEGHRGT